MKKILTLLFCLIVFASAGWRTDFEKAKADAAKEHKYILLNFSSSDLCMNSIMMKRKIFTHPAFEEYADNHLILVNADFPQQKRNKPTKKVQRQNDRLAEKYNKGGIFPLTLLLDSKGEVMASWQGYSNEMSPEMFIEQVKAAIHE